MANSPAATNQITQEGGRLFSCSFLTQQVPKAHQACSLGRVRETLNNKLVTDKPDDPKEPGKKSPSLVEGAHTLGTQMARQPDYYRGRCPHLSNVSRPNHRSEGGEEGPAEQDR